ncbi:collagen alpha-6(VI) chain [Biomphalaria glabrata]|nr:collagen alpha-6(VI) chain [Biomphalaria glabrata]
MCNTLSLFADCAQKLDLVIILDTSGSVTEPNFKLSIAFIQNLLKPLHIGPDNIRVALMRYSTDVEVVSYLNERMNKEEKEKDVLTIQYKSGGTHTHEALKKTRTDVLLEKNGDRPEVQDLVVLITDEMFTSRETKEEAMKLKSKQYLKILTIGVTKDIDESELRNVSSGADLFLKINSFAEFNRHIHKVKPVICSGGNVSLNAQPSVQGVKGKNDSSLQNFETSTTFKTCLTSFTYHNKLMTSLPLTITHQPESVSSHVESGSIFSTSSVFSVTSIPSLPLITLDSSVMPSLSVSPTVISPLKQVSKTYSPNTDLFSSTVMQDIVTISESNFRSNQSIKDTVVLPWISTHETLSPTFLSHTYLTSFILNTAMLVSPSSSEIKPSLVSSGSEIQSYIAETGVLDTLIFPSSSISDTVALPLLSMINYPDQNREANNKLPSYVPTNSILSSSEVSFSLPKELSSLSSVRTSSLKNNKLLESFTSYTNQFTERAQPTSSSVWNQSVMIENYNASIVTGAESSRTLWTYLSATIAGFIAVLLAGVFLAVVWRKSQERARQEAAQINVEAQ